MEEVIGIGKAMKKSGLDQTAQLESTGRSVEKQTIFERTCCVCNNVSESPKSGGSSKQKKKTHRAAAMRKYGGCAKSPDAPWYCSRAYQLQHWKEHNKTCSKEAASKKQRLGVELS